MVCCESSLARGGQSCTQAHCRSLFSQPREQSGDRVSGCEAQPALFSEALPGMLAVRASPTSSQGSPAAGSSPGEQQPPGEAGEPQAFPAEAAHSQREERSWLGLSRFPLLLPARPQLLQLPLAAAQPLQGAAQPRPWCCSPGPDREPGPASSLSVPAPHGWGWAGTAGQGEQRARWPGWRRVAPLVTQPRR